MALANSHCSILGSSILESGKRIRSMAMGLNMPKMVLFIKGNGKMELDEMDGCRSVNPKD